MQHCMYGKLVKMQKSYSCDEAVIDQLSSSDSKTYMIPLCFSFIVEGNNLKEQIYKSQTNPCMARFNVLCFRTQPWLVASAQATSVDKSAKQHLRRGARKYRPNASKKTRGNQSSKALQSKSMQNCKPDCNLFMSS